MTDLIRFESTMQKQDQNSFPLSAKLVRFEPGQSLVSIRLDNNHHKNKHLYSVQSVELGNNCPPWKSYRDKLIAQEPSYYENLSNLIQHEFKNNKTVWSHLFSFYTAKETGNTNPFWQIEIIIMPNANSAVIGYDSRIKTPSIIVKNKTLPFKKEEASAIFSFQNTEPLQKPVDLQNCLLLSKNLCETIANQAPSNKIKQTDSFAEILNAISNGDSIQCGQAANLLTQYLIVHGVTVRMIGLYRYAEVGPGIINNTHVALEIFDEKINDWIFLDPSYGVYFTFNKKPLSLEEIKNTLLQGDLSKIAPQNFANITQTFSAELVLRDRDPFSYDYFGHFGIIEIQNLSISD